MPRTEDSIVKELKSFEAADVEARLLRARESFPDFCEYAAVDDKGRRWNFAPHQYEWSALFDDPLIELLLIVSSRGSAKSTTLQNRCAWEIGRNPDLCIKYVTGADDKATDRLNWFRNNLVSNPRYTEVFPHIRPAGIAEWTKHKMTVERPAGLGLQDATIEAACVGTGGTGGRCHILVFDDIIDATDAYSTPAFMARTKRFVEQSWMNTLHPGGRVWMIGTFWCFDPPDLYVEYSQNPDWTRWIKPACDITKDGRLCGSALHPVLWPEKWPLDELEKRRQKIRDEAFFQQYLLKGATSRKQLFNREHIDACKSYTCALGDIPDGRQVVRAVTALDPATSRDPRWGSNACIYTAGLLDDGRRFPLSIITMQQDPEVLIQSLLADYRAWSTALGCPFEIVVENNATQESFATIMRLLGDPMGLRDLPIRRCFTGSQKFSPDGGLAARSVELAQKKWVIPFAGEHLEAFHCCPVCEWLNEMHYWGKTLDGEGKRVMRDIIMAWWMAGNALGTEDVFGELPVVASATVREVRFGQRRRIA